jgi:hypothetical protein
MNRCPQNAPTERGFPCSAEKVFPREIGPENEKERPETFISKRSFIFSDRSPLAAERLLYVTANLLGFALRFLSEAFSFETVRAYGTTDGLLGIAHRIVGMTGGFICSRR